MGNSLRNSPSYRDVRVAGVECPDQLPVNNRASIKATVAQVGLTGRVVKASLEEDGKEVATAELELKAGDASQPVAFEFVPETKGRHTYNVRLAPFPDEKIQENNHRSAIAQVVDARIRVLYVEGALRAEYGALVQRFFSKDPDIEFCALVRTRPGVFVTRTNRAGFDLKGIPTDPAVLETFDVFVLGDLDSAAWPPKALEGVVNRVRAGAGLLMIGGYHSLGPGGFATTSLAAVLPVELGARDVGQVTEPFVPRLTPAGRAHPLFANIARFFPGVDAAASVSGLPPLDGCVKVLNAKPGATVLALGPGSSALPVLAVQPVGKGRSAVFTGDTTRNWQQAPRALEQESPFLRFWGQTIRWLANRTSALSAGAGVVARTDRAYYEPDTPIVVEAVVRDKEGEGTDKAEVAAKVVGPGGEASELTLSAVAGSTGTYRGALEPKGPGTYQLEVAAKLDGQELRAERLVADVGRPNLEFDRLDLDEKLLTRVAEASGGRYRHISTADHLLDELDRTAAKRRVSWEQPLSWPWPYWGLVVGLLGVEWFLRKRCQLR
ncbi:MAG: glutamine amidotransferase [Isosphaeraceae bacterium]